MPFYTFKCPSCKKEEDVLQTMKAPNPVCKRCVDASCGTHTPEMDRIWRPSARPHFKGEGFYETDYKRPTIAGMHRTPEAAEKAAKIQSEKRAERKNK